MFLISYIKFGGLIEGWLLSSLHNLYYATSWLLSKMLQSALCSIFTVMLVGHSVYQFYFSELFNTVMSILLWYFVAFLVGLVVLCLLLYLTKYSSYSYYF